jgi:hypothetical protein
MALLDEDKLQGNVYMILQLLRQEQACCSFISAQWMDDSGGTPVFVLVAENGDVTVKDSPTGTIQTSPLLPLAPLTP